MTIYVVTGTCGDYSSRNEWLVKAFFDERRAQEHAENATRRAAQLKVIYARTISWGVRNEMGKQNEFDPMMGFDSYTDTTYAVSVVAMEEQA